MALQYITIECGLQAHHHLTWVVTQRAYNMNTSFPRKCGTDI